MMKTKQRRELPEVVETPRRRKTHWTIMVLLAVVMGVNLLCMPAMFWSGDPEVWREEAKAILHGQLAINDNVAQIWQETFERGQFFVFNDKTQRYYSKYGIGNAIMCLPPIIADQLVAGRPLMQMKQPELLILNLYQILQSLVVCALLYQLAGRYTSRPITRFIYVLSVFFGTYFWYYQRAQGAELYQAMFFIAMLCCFLPYLDSLGAGRIAGEPRHIRLLFAWLFVAMLISSRILFALLIPVLVIGAAVRIWRLGSPARRQIVLRELAYLAMPPILIIAALAWINTLKFGEPWLTGYHQWRPEDHWPVGSLWEGLYGFLFDMRGSIFWYFPVMIFALLGVRRFYAAHKADALVIGSVFVLFLLVLGKTPTWLGECTHGPRYLIFGLPAFGLPFITFIDSLLNRPRRWTAYVAGAVTAAVLVYSGYLEERVNRLSFFAYYRVTDPLGSTFSLETANYCLGHHRGVFCANLIRYRDKPWELPFVKALEDTPISKSDFDNYKQYLLQVVAKDNYYWKVPRTPAVNYHLKAPTSPAENLYSKPGLTNSP